MNTIASRDKQTAVTIKPDCNVLIDGHVHIHECFSRAGFLDAAATNFSEASREIGVSGRANYVLLLCDVYAQCSFSKVNRVVESKQSSSRWTLCSTLEPAVIAAKRDDDVQLLLIAGRQIQTHDQLEVLALCTNEQFPDGLSTTETIAAVRDAGAVAVLPWGFGKWLGKRAGIVNQLIRKHGTESLVLGDNGGRLHALPEPSQFRVARELGIKILAGTDPLPFRDQQHRAGRYGSYFQGPFDNDNPAKSIRSLLYEDSRPLVTYGRRESLLPFFVNQLRMQLRKRRFRSWMIA